MRNTTTKSFAQGNIPNTLRAVLVGVLLLGRPALAIPPEHPPFEAWDNPVASIPYAHRISTWQPLDTSHVLVSVDSRNRYLITLRAMCPGLNYARDVGVTMSNNTIWAGFDAITTGTIQCEIERIDRLAEPRLGESAPGS